MSPWLTLSDSVVPMPPSPEQWIPVHPTLGMILGTAETFGSVCLVLNSGMEAQRISIGLLRILIPSRSVPSQRLPLVVQSHHLASTRMGTDRKGRHWLHE